MKTSLFALLLSLLLLSPLPRLLAQTTAWTDHTRVLPDRLRQVPMGLTLWHSPNPSYPEANPEAPGQFVWKHDTSVRAEVDDLEVVECGSFIWYNETGWQANRRMSPAEFADAFSCPGGRLRKGRAYSFPKNYRYAANAGQLYGGDALWYILAKDRNGRLYKGMGLLETESQVGGGVSLQPAR